MTEPRSWLFTGSLNGHTGQQLMHAALQKLIQQGVISVIPTERAVHPGGKPYFADQPSLHFSISHTRSQWACLFANMEVGLDIEEIRSCRQEVIAERFFHPLEQAWLKRHPEDFFRIWTAKESLVKWSGRGLAEAFSGFSTVDTDGFFCKSEEWQLLPLNIKKGTAGTLCLSVPLAYPMIRELD